MSQSVRTINQIINQAFFLASILGEGEVLSGANLELGFNLLNELIDQYSSNGMYIPFNENIDFNLTQGQQRYRFSNQVTADVVSNRIADIDFVNLRYPNQTLVYSILQIPQAQYYDATHIEYQARPVEFWLERDIQYSDVLFYPIPDRPYEVTIRAKFFIDSFTEFTPITNVPLSWHRFLRYALARELTTYFPSSVWNQKTEDEYQRMYKDILASNTKDVVVRPSNLLKAQTFDGGFNNEAIING